MTNIIDFNARKKRAGRVYCPMLDLYFPDLMKVTQHFSDDFDFAAIDMTPRKESVIHTFSQSRSTFPNLVSCDPVEHLEKTDTFSLYVRHHHTLEEARAYGTCLYDFGISYVLDNTIVSGEGGSFTLLVRPLTADQPTPSITYYAAMPDPTSVFGAKEWSQCIDTEGVSSDSPDFGGSDTEIVTLLPAFF